MSSNTPQTVAGSAAGTPPGVPNHVQQNLQRLDRLANLGLFSASIAHEIKNGLVAVNTYCEVMMEKGEHREMAEMVRREIKRIDELATQMLRFAAPAPAALAPVNVHVVLDHSLRLLEHQMQDRMVKLWRDYRAAPHLVQGDESRLQQAFMNLLLNALEAMPQGGDLAVGTVGAGPVVKIAIRDTGSGVMPENFPRLFETFFTTKKHGTGLGLSISRRMVEEHGGTIEVQSTAGSGSTFTVSLPLLLV